jgi:cell division protein FtsX
MSDDNEILNRLNEIDRYLEVLAFFVLVILVCVGILLITVFNL